MFANIIVYSSVAGLSTVVGVYLVRRFAAWTRNNSMYLISFAVGVIMANAFFNLLPEAAKLDSAWVYFAFAGFIALYFVEYGMNTHYCHEEECEVRSIGLISTVGIGLHSLLDGFTIGVGFEAGFALGVITSFAVIFHELPEGVFTYTLLMHDRVSERRSLIYSWAVALATPVGAVLTFLFVRGASEAVIGSLIALAGGTFIYIGAADLVPETHRRSTVWNALLVLAGAAFVLLLSRFLG